MKILAIDPGDVQSAYSIIDIDTYKPLKQEKIENEELYNIVSNEEYDLVVIEMIASYGMPVGKSVFETCITIGRIIQIAVSRNIIFKLMYRQKVKLNLCNSMKAKDSNIRQALIDRFGVVGTKKEPGWFYGFKNDIWAAYAVGITYIDMQKRGESYGN